MRFVQQLFFCEKTISQVPSLRAIGYNKTKGEKDESGYGI